MPIRGSCSSPSSPPTGPCIAGALAERVTAGLRELEDCCACPRNCHVNRMENQTRVCHTGRYARVASAFAHFGEEDCLRGWNGSGTIFFSLCNLRLRLLPELGHQPADRRL